MEHEQKDPTKLVDTLLAGQTRCGRDRRAARNIGRSRGSTNWRTWATRPPLSRAAWNDAGHDVEAFVSQLAQQPSLVSRATAGTEGVESVLSEITQFNAHLGQSLDDLWQRAGADFTAFRNEIEDWFDREMARVSGWYSAGASGSWSPSRWCWRWR